MLFLTFQAKILHCLLPSNQLADKNGYMPSSSTTVTTHASFTKKILAFFLNSIRNLMIIYRKNFLHRLHIANLFLPDLWNYVYEYGHQSESTITPLVYYDPLKYTIKAQNLEATLLAIILIYNVFCVPLPK